MEKQLNANVAFKAPVRQQGSKAASQLVGAWQPTMFKCQLELAPKSAE